MFTPKISTFIVIPVLNTKFSIEIIKIVCIIGLIDVYSTCAIRIYLPLYMACISIMFYDLAMATRENTPADNTSAGHAA